MDMQVQLRKAFECHGQWEGVRVEKGTVGFFNAQMTDGDGRVKYSVRFSALRAPVFVDPDFVEFI